MPALSIIANRESNGPRKSLPAFKLFEDITTRSPNAVSVFFPWNAAGETGFIEV